MRNITDYVEAALERQKLPSRRKLAEKMALSQPSVMINWERKGMLPTDEHMLALAKEAGVPSVEALCDLSIWRAQSKRELKAVEAWKQVRKAVTGTTTAAIIAVGAIQGLNIGNAHASSPAYDSQSRIGFILWKI